VIRVFSVPRQVFFLTVTYQKTVFFLDGFIIFPKWPEEQSWKKVDTVCIGMATELENLPKCMKEKKSRTLAFRPTPRILEAMEEVCEIRGLTKTQIIEHALEEYLFFPELQKNEKVREALEFLYAVSAGSMIQEVPGAKESEPESAL